MLAWLAVLVRITPRIGRHRLLQIWTVPFGLVRGAGYQCSEPLRRGRIVAGIEAILVQGLCERVNLGTRDFDLGLTDLPEVLGSDITGKQADNNHNDQEFEKSEAPRDKSRSNGCCLYV